MIDGRNYQIGEQIQPNCSARCICEEDGQFDCEAVSCPVDGPPCTIFGHPHYATWDNRFYHYSGKCEYYLAKPCDSDAFLISTVNSHCGIFSSCVEQVRIVIPDHSPREILLSSGHRNRATITIDGQLQEDTGDIAIIASPTLEVVRVGGNPIVTLKGHGVRIKYDGHRSAKVYVAKSLRGQVCGQCGTYNGNPFDDFTTPDGDVVVSPNVFADSWGVPGCLAKRDASGYEGCYNDSATVEEAQMRCNVMTEGSFADCNAVVDPTFYISACEFDYCCCLLEEREECYCSALAVYAAACADAGAQPSNWRDEYGCRKLCIVQSLYHERIL